MKIEVLEIIDDLVAQINALLVVNTGSDFLDLLDSDTITQMGVFIEAYYDSSNYKNTEIHMVHPYGVKPRHKSNTEYVRQFWLKVVYVDIAKGNGSPSYSLYKHK